jgi:hypothetical protein
MQWVLRHVASIAVYHMLISEESILQNRTSVLPVAIDSSFEIGWPVIVSL